MTTDAPAIVRIVSQEPPPPDGDPFDPPTLVERRQFADRDDARAWLGGFVAPLRGASSGGMVLLRDHPDEVVYRTPFGWVLMTIEPGG